MKRSLFSLMFLLFLSSSYAQRYGQWGVPPSGWGDFAIGLTDDATKLPIITTAKATTSLQYRVRYINSGVDTLTNWYSWQPSGGIATQYISTSEAIGMRAAFNIYMLQEDAGANVAISNMASVNFMTRFFWNIRFVAKKSSGHKVVFIIEPDTWGYLIAACYGTSPWSAGNPAIRPNSVFCNVNNLGYAELAGLPNTMAGMAQGIIKMIRVNAPDAYVGFHSNTWAVWSNGQTGPSCLGANAGGFYQCQAGLPFWNLSDIDYSANFQIAWYQELFGGVSSCDRGDFLVVEKYGFDEGGRWIAFGAGASTLYYGSTQYLNWRHWSKKFAQGLNLPLLAWQMPLGNTTLGNTMQQYQDTYVQNFFANSSGYICDGFIGSFMGPGVGASTYYTNGAGATGDNGYFFSNLRSQFDPGRPYNLNLATSCAATLTALPGACTLPVNFINFYGKHLPAGNQIDWDVNGEIKVNHYVVERSVDGLVFTSVGIINPNGEGTGVKSYDYIDQFITSGTTYYYRIREVDDNGFSTFSTTISIGDENKVLVSLYPNPFSQQVTASIASPSDRSLILQVYNANGNIVFNQVIETKAGIQEVLKIDNMSNSASGLYYFKLFDESTGEILESQLMIKQ